MKIKEIKIYGYGKLENLDLSLDEDLNVLFGENEMGKSTIMSFIHSILFGFPLRTQSEFLRYEPKFHSKYGGMLVVKFSGVGLVKVERVKGKAIGDVTVTMPDGEIGREELLTELLHGMDSKMFRSIYSFNIHSIQNVQAVSGEDLNRFLFSSSVIGTDKLMDVEKKLQKELDDRFKRQGQNPTLNKILTEITEKETVLLKGKRENDTYFSLLKNQAELKQKEVDFQKEIKEIQSQIHLLREWQKMQPVLLEKKEIEEELNELGETPFPADGKNKIKDIQQLLLRLKSQIAGKEESLQRIEKEITENEPKLSILANEAEITWANETVVLHETLLYEKASQEERLLHINEDITQLKDAYHLQMKKETVVKINTSVSIKEEVLAIDRETMEIQKKREEVTERIKEQERAASLLGEEKRKVRAEILPDEERQALEEQSTQKTKLTYLKKQYEAAVEQTLLLQKNERKEKAAAKKQRIETTLIVAILLALTVWSVLNGDMFVAIATISGVLILLWMRRSAYVRKGTTNISEEIIAAQKHEQDLAEQLKNIVIVDESKRTDRLKKDDELRQKDLRMTIRLGQLREDNEGDEILLRKYKEDELLLNRACKKYAMEWGMDEETVCTRLFSVFQALTELKKLYRLQEQAQNELQVTMTKIREIETRIFKLAEACHLSGESSLYRIATELKGQREEEVEKDIKIKENQKKIFEQKSELQQLTAERDQLLEEEMLLYEAAKVTTFDQFYKKGQQAERKELLQQRQNDVSRQIDATVIDQVHQVWKDLSPDGKEEITRSEQRLTVLDTYLKETQSEGAKVNHEIHLLEEGGTYADLLHRYKLLEASFNEEAREWAQYALAKQLLSKTMAKYKEEKLPNVLKRAGGYLFELTDGAYRSIFMEREKGFMIERKDYVLFEPGELSQATAEQVYVALRLALVTTLGEQAERYPLLVDDSFVNFDEGRLQRTVMLLKKISKKHQIIFFTCHPHIKRLFQKENIIELSRKTSGKV